MGLKDELLSKIETEIETERKEQIEKEKKLQQEKSKEIERCYDSIYNAFIDHLKNKMKATFINRTTSKCIEGSFTISGKRGYPGNPLSNATLISVDSDNTTIFCVEGGAFGGYLFERENHVQDLRTGIEKLLNISKTDVHRGFQLNPIESNIDSLLKYITDQSGNEIVFSTKKKSNMGVILFCILAIAVMTIYMKVQVSQ